MIDLGGEERDVAIGFVGEQVFKIRTVLVIEQGYVFLDQFSHEVYAAIQIYFFGGPYGECVETLQGQAALWLGKGLGDLPFREVYGALL